MNFKVSFFFLFFSTIKILNCENIDSIIHEKVHVTNDDDQENTGEDENDNTKSSYAYQQSPDLSEQQPLLGEIQTKKIQHPIYPIRTMVSNTNSISKVNHMIITKPKPVITQPQNTFSESDNQQVVQQQYYNEMESSYQYPSTSATFSSSDSQHQENTDWPYSNSNSQSVLVTSKSTEFTVNSNTLNFTNQGLDNLKSFNITSANHIIPSPTKTFASIMPAANYNQQDPLSPMQMIANPIQNLVLRSFENFRHLIKSSEIIENFIHSKMNIPKWTKVHTLDPLDLPESLYFEHRDPKTPLLGKLKFTLGGVQVIGLSTFKTENLSNQGRTLYFKHRIPQLDFHANYTVDYHLFDEIPLLISRGYLKALLPNVYIKGSFTVLPDILNVWFKIANLDMSSTVEECDVKVSPVFSISDRFRVERSTLNKFSAAIASIMPTIIEYLKLTYSKTIEMKIV